MANQSNENQMWATSKEERTVVYTNAYEGQCFTPVEIRKCQKNFLQEIQKPGGTQN